MTANGDDPDPDVAHDLRFKAPQSEPIEFTGEHFVPGLTGPIQHEHHHRYLVAAPFCRDRFVLDIACGEGYGADLLAQAAALVVGLDIDLAAVAAARRRYGSERLRFVPADATAVPFASSSFDVATSFETIEHVADWRTFISEVARVLRPDGLLIVSSPNRPVYSDGGSYQNPFHVHEFDREEFRAALAERFRNVVLLGQRAITGSVIVAEGGPAAAGAMAGMESDDGLNYRTTAGLPDPRYFVAFASNGPLPPIGGSVLVDSSHLESLQRAASAGEALLGERDRELAALRATLAAVEMRLAGLDAQVERAERQVRALRASHQQWLGRAPAPEPLREAPEPTAPTVTPAAETPVPDARTLVAQARQAFDADYYLRSNPSVAETGADPFHHYMTTGWRMGLDPAPGFSTRYYLESYPDVRASRLNPFVHYLGFGRGEGRRPRPPEQTAATDLVDLPAKPVARLDEPPPTATRARLVAFYLPQFHAIPENDDWWGAGFTEWTNVRAARPRFEGHDQPRIPGELGYYDLLDPAVQHRQVALARLYGIGGFCFYFYWFGGKRLLEKPVEAWLADPSLDFPFCLCWANENWTRRWDGRDNQVLVAQAHSPDDDLAFIRAVAPYLSDPRYIRIDGRPLLVVYRPALLPSARATAGRWRDWCRTNGVGEIHLAYTQSFEEIDPAEIGFDAAIEFPPNNSSPPDLSHAVRPLAGVPSVEVFDWRVFHERSQQYRQPSYPLYRAVCPGWDNTPRRRDGGTVFVGNTPALYREWLANAVADTEARFHRPDQRLIFVNSWNEWAEGAHLEPDTRHGYAWLQATRDAVERAPAMVRAIVLVSHDAHPHGAQFLALHLARAYAGLGFRVHMIVLGDGPLLERFAEFAQVERFDLALDGPAAAGDHLRRLRGEGVRVAIVNTTVSASLLPLLREAGFATIALIHEMPGILAERQLGDAAEAVAVHADQVVFPARLVQDGFERFLGRPLARATILPQGVIRRNPFRDRGEHARRLVCERLGLPVGTQIVLAIAYLEHRKGPDLFVEIADRVLSMRQDIAFVWIGHADRELERTVKDRVADRRLADRVRFVDFVAEPLEFYAAASVYALTSREDPFPNVVLESAEAGVPVVAFNGTTGAADFIRERGGRLASAFDVTDFATQVLGLLARPYPPPDMPVPSIRQYALDLLHHAAGEPRLSVIVPNFGYARYLRARLEGICSQTRPIYELIVLDDASTDDSIAVAQSTLAEWPDIDATLVINQENSGSVFRQWRRGLTRCRGDLVWIAEADDLAHPTFAERLSAALHDPRVVLAYCQSAQIDETGRTIAPNYLDYTSDISEAWRADHIHDGLNEISGAMAIKNTIPNVSATIFRRTALERAFESLGDSLFAYRVAGDWILYMEILLQGDIRFVAEALNHHRRHRSSVTSGTEARRHLDEVAAAQAIAARHVRISDETRAKARAWLEHVRRHLNVPVDASVGHAPG